MLLYVFTNFAFIFEIVAKLTDFDGTSDLRTNYVLGEEEETEAVLTENKEEDYMKDP
jgi:hypothetical protein